MPLLPVDPQRSSRTAVRLSAPAQALRAGATGRSRDADPGDSVAACALPIQPRGAKPKRAGAEETVLQSRTEDDRVHRRRPALTLPTPLRRIIQTVHQASRPALFVDLDGTVRETLTGRVHPVEPWDQRLLPGVSERLAEYRERGHAVVGVTNQGGVALGVLSEEDVEAINRRLADELAPGLFDLILYCPYHPYARLSGYLHTADCRKPRPGMAFAARDRLGLDLAASVMVGDAQSDREFARNAGIGRFFWADAFFGASVDADLLDLPRAAAE
jgi:D-glycero-D-manno-heptose 1,7-bisphosphate phosphatase